MFELRTSTFSVCCGGVLVGRRYCDASIVTAGTPFCTIAGTDIGSIAFMPRSTPCGVQIPCLRFACGRIDGGTETGGTETGGTETGGRESGGSVIGAVFAGLWAKLVFP